MANIVCARDLLNPEIYLLRLGARPDADAGTDDAGSRRSAAPLLSVADRAHLWLESSRRRAAPAKVAVARVLGAKPAQLGAPRHTPEAAARVAAAAGRGQWGCWHSDCESAL